MKVLRNELHLESSPYLRQHQDNPIHWQSWGPQAFERASELDRPIFLSIGYATCHWCHVMEGDSFIHDDVAEILNQSFVSIKVDREERPDVDSIYMSVVLMHNGHGGWPMSLILTPQGIPIWAGTFLRRAEFKHILQRVAEIWAQPALREQMLKSVVDNHKVFQDSLKTPSPGEHRKNQAFDVNAVAQIFYQRFDQEWGGFFGAPKFPQSPLLMLLNRIATAKQDDQLIGMLSKTLDCMALGGLFDQLQGGFHRYATDHQWRVPHFEKMLYDNALLLMVYTEAWQITGRPLYANICERTLDYILTCLSDESGGFYSGEDADSEKTEGLYYLWTLVELRSLLNAEQISLLMKFMDLKEDGNFQPPRGISEIEKAAGLKEPEAMNILYFLNPNNPEILSFLTGEFREIQRILIEARKQRVRPLVDTKQITAWNGLLLAAFAKHSLVFDHPDSKQGMLKLIDRFKAIYAKHQMLTHLLNESYSSANPLPRQVDDYAMVIWGLIESYQVLGDESLLSFAIELQEQQIAVFYDKESGLFNDADGSDPFLIHMPRSLHDQAIPSGNSVSAYNLLRLQALGGDRWRDILVRLMDQALALNQRSLLASPLLSITQLEERSKSGIVHGYFRNQASADFLEWRKSFHPHLLSVIHEGAQSGLEGLDNQFQYCTDKACEAAEENFLELKKHLPALNAVDALP